MIEPLLAAGTKADVEKALRAQVVKKEVRAALLELIEASPGDCASVSGSLSFDEDWRSGTAFLSLRFWPSKP